MSAVVGSMNMPEVRRQLVTELWIDGSPRAARTGGQLVVTDPSKDELLATVSAASEEDVDDAISAARTAQPRWWARRPQGRAAVLFGIADLIRRDAELLALVESLDTGKPLSQARTDVEVAAQYFAFYAGITDKLYGHTIPLDAVDFASTFREPLGVTGHIVPWNYPLQISSRTIAPSLAAGNAVVLKPAEEAPLTALLLGRLVTEAGAPPGLVNVVPGSGQVAGAALAASDAIDHLSFTGGTVAGRLVMTALAKNLKPSTMELGGKSPSLVMDDADLDRAVPVITKALIQNSGQTCSAGSRVIVARSLHDELVGRLETSFREVELGAGPADPDMGPVISRKQHTQVLDAIERAESEGAHVICGGKSADVEGAGGWFVRPTLLTQVTPTMEVAQQEVFGPVLCVLEADSESQAIDLANGTEFGLIAAIWTGSVDRAMRVARALTCGQVYINSYGAGGGVALPFGGVGKSGFGREKGVEALMEYSQTKVIVFNSAVADD